jgi:hypothetical protein
MDELQLYGKEGLFHNIVKQSAIMDGRYGVIEKGGDLNLNNVLSGIEFPESAYPGVFCLPPISAIKEVSVQQATWECFYFRLFFMCTTESTGDNQLKGRIPETNTSSHKVNMDWNDMKVVAMNFINALEQLQRNPEIRGKFRLGQKEPWKIVRLSRVNNPVLSGVMLQFEGELSVPCEFTDININNSEVLAGIINGIAAPHATHFH